MELPVQSTLKGLEHHSCRWQGRRLPSTPVHYPLLATLSGVPGVPLEPYPTGVSPWSGLLPVTHVGKEACRTQRGGCRDQDRDPQEKMEGLGTSKRCRWPGLSMKRVACMKGAPPPILRGVLPLLEPSSQHPQSNSILTGSFSRRCHDVGCRWPSGLALSWPRWCECKQHRPSCRGVRRPRSPAAALPHSLGRGAVHLRHAGVL